MLKCLLLLYESKEWPKKGTRRPTKTAKNTQIVIFGQKKAPAASRQPRKMVLFLEKRYLGKKKSACGKPPAKKRSKMPIFFSKKWQKTPKSSRNGHPWVEIGRRPYQNDQKSKIYKNPIEFLRQTLKNEGLRRILWIDFFVIFGPINKIERAI